MTRGKFIIFGKPADWMEIKTKLSAQGFSVNFFDHLTARCTRTDCKGFWIIERVKDELHLIPQICYDFDSPVVIKKELK